MSIEKKIQFDDQWEVTYIGEDNIIGILSSYDCNKQDIPEELIYLFSSTWGNNWKQYCNCIDNQVLKTDISINLDDYIDLIEMLEVLDLEDNELWKKQLIEKFKLTEILFIKVKHLNDNDFNKLKIMLLFLKTPRVVILFDKNIDLVSNKEPIYEFLQEYMMNMNKTVVFISNDENKLQKICGVIYIYKRRKENEKIFRNYEKNL